MKKLAFVLLFFVAILSVDCFANTGDCVTQTYDLKYELKAGKDTGAIYKILWDQVFVNVSSDHFEIFDYICVDNSECKITIRYLDKSDNFSGQYLEVKVKNSGSDSADVEIVSYGKVFNKYAVSIYQRVSNV
ncbi:MAG: hypothetical protein C0614_03555 [Desulfuromonas sp.]|nr:MAG: hypothetical protein C0614_03555 [Desulfuromonas sp.]